ncbi:MAG TPA: GPW/gp25 family protein [Roseiarcus sp.]|jgi:phage baseplate assembly protein W|nr:GPW/gp25 family protein [Roseiarcus sp.]
MINIAFPYRVDSAGRTGRSGLDDHIRELIEQTLFTSPGERVNRPTFGAGVAQLVFAPNSGALATATQLLVQGALQQWLSDLIQVEAVSVESQDATLAVTVQYVVRRTQQRQVATVSKAVPS